MDEVGRKAGGCTSRSNTRLDGAPILVLQGTEDTHVPVSRCYAFEKLFRNVEFVAYPGVHHQFDKEGKDLVARDGRIMRWNQAAAEDARRRVTAFLVRVLKG